MNYIPFDYIKYFIYEYFDQKRIKDEREEFLILKKFELVQKVTVFSVSLLALAYLLYPAMPISFCRLQGWTLPMIS